MEWIGARIKSIMLVSGVLTCSGFYALVLPRAAVAGTYGAALEGPIAPMECFHVDREGRVLCSHESDGDRACATKFLWTRVHGGVTKALAGTTLADLVEFSEATATPEPVEAPVA